LQAQQTRLPIVEREEEDHEPLYADVVRPCGIVFLMTTKPALASAIGAMVVSALLGLASGVPFVLVRPTTPSDRLQPHEEDAS
jgi:hypothetical protein